MGSTISSRQLLGRRLLGEQLDHIHDDICRYIRVRTKTEKKHVTRVREEREEEKKKSLMLKHNQMRTLLCEMHERWTRLE